MVYISTFTPGFESVIKNILPVILKGSKIINVNSGLVSYKFNGDPTSILEVVIFNNSYHVIKSFTGKKLSFHKMVNEIIHSKNKYLNQNELKFRGKTFRIRFSKENRFTKVNKQVVTKAENEVAKATSLIVNRLNPETEFWYIIRRENIAYYAQLLSKRTYTEKNLNKGELRPEFALLIAYWAQIKANDVVMDPFAGYGSIPLQIYKNLKFHKLIVNDIDINKVKYIKKLFAKFKEAKNVEIICKDSMCLPNIGDKTIDKIIADPPWGIYEEIGDIQDFYHNLLVEFKRVLKDEGEIIILTSGKIELENAASSCGLKIFDKIDTLVNGKKAGVFKLVKNSQIKVNN
ncbi:MAG TPA: methyltransferase [Clostridiaceae bacterium]|jgi:tRNA G10  N-methylase Trm11|nr:methyltransferase [Clostridiaceae bacterium]